MTDLAARTRLQDELTALRGDVGGVRGALVATCDGHPIVHNLPSEAADDGGRSAAAMIAALLGIGRRLAELTDDPELLEATVRSAAGSVVVYAVGAQAVMTVLTDDSVNVARLKLAVRHRLPALTAAVAALSDPAAVTSAGPGGGPPSHGHARNPRGDGSVARGFSGFPPPGWMRGRRRCVELGS